MSDAKKTENTSTAAGTSATVSCPQCGAAVVWQASSRWKPFCSERCKMLDFGAWANESYRIAATEIPDVADIDAALNAHSPNQYN